MKCALIDNPNNLYTLQVIPRWEDDCSETQRMLVEGVSGQELDFHPPEGHQTAGREGRSGKE